MTDLPTTPAELSALFRHTADMLDELHARQEGTWEAQPAPLPTPDETILFAPEPRGSPLTRRVQLLRQVLDEDGHDVLYRDTDDDRALIAAGLLEVVRCDFADHIARDCLTSSDALETMTEPDVYALAAATLGPEPDEPPSTVRTDLPAEPAPMVASIFDEPGAAECVLDDLRVHAPGKPGSTARQISLRTAMPLTDVQRALRELGTRIDAAGKTRGRRYWVREGDSA